MQKLNADVFFGTMERPNEKLIDAALLDPKASKYIKGVGTQWAAKRAIPGIHRRYSDLKLYQTEQECGDGSNDWRYCRYAWTLMKHYLENGASAYYYWNISLQQGGVSRWGWAQNSPQERDKSGEPVRGPATAREWLSGVKLVLRHDHADVDALPRVILDEPRKVAGVSAEIPILLDELVATLFNYLVRFQPVGRHILIGHLASVVIVVFHPSWSTPGGGPELQSGLIFQRVIDE